MKTNIRKITGLLIVGLVLFVGCGGGNQNSNGNDSGTADNQSGLTKFEQVNGIGPIDEKIELGSLNEAMAEKGEKIFQTKCSACHKMTDRYVGPALGDILDKRTPAYVMNMILNSDQMVKEHPEAKKMLAEFMTPMPNQNLSKEEARAVVEYLRENQKKELSTN